MATESKEGEAAAPAVVKLFGGIEGGATKTNMVIIDNKRNILAEGELGPSNPWLVGFDGSAGILLELIEQTKSRLPKEAEQKPVVLHAIGMSLSGCGQEQSRNQLRDALEKRGADVKTIFIEEDILAPVFAMSNKGGVNMICGTGSNCVVYNDDGSSKRAGGWGHLLGDEGGAYYISHLAIKTLFDHFDNYITTVHDTSKVQQALYKYLKISSMDAVLEHFYKEFSKDNIAGFAKDLSRLADDGDKLAMAVYHQAGCEIGRHILAIQHSIKTSTLHHRNLHVLCTGSVFKSWKHLKPGFEKMINSAKQSAAKGNSPFAKMAKRVFKQITGGDVDGSELTKGAPPLTLNKHVGRITLVTLKIPAAVGAAVWAAGKVNELIEEGNKKNIIEKIDEIRILPE